MYNVFTEDINKIALSPNDDKRMRSIDFTETYAHGKSRDLVCKKEEVKCNNIIKQYNTLTITITKENIKEHNPNPDYPYRISIAGGSVSGNTNAFLI